MGIQWHAWGTAVRVDVTDERALPSARRLVAALVTDAERAADVYRPSARVHGLVRAGGRPVRVGATLSALVAEALDVAERTDGAVDPTVGASTLPLRRAARCPGTARPPALPTCTAFPYLAPRPAAGWRCVDWAGHEVTVPAAVSLDLTATAKARTARLAATRVAERLGVGALVEIGGDVATAGPHPGEGWLVRPAHAGGALFEVPAGTAVAACRASGVVDPLTGRSVGGDWQAVVAIAADVVAAKAAALAALVRGDRAGTEDGVRTLFVPGDGRQPTGSAA